MTLKNTKLVNTSHNRIRGSCFKKFTTIHDRLVLEMNRCLQEEHVPEWMTKERTTLIQKEPPKGTAPKNYRPIMYLPMIWKILTVNKWRDLFFAYKPQIVFWWTERMPQRIQRHTRALYINQHILNENKTRRKNLAIAWIDCKNAYNMVQQRRMYKMYKISDEVKLYRENHENLESGIDSRRENLSWNTEPKWFIRRKCTITITIL